VSCKCSLFFSLARIKWVRFTCSWRAVNEVNYFKNSHFFPIIFSLFPSTSSAYLRICFWGTHSLWWRGGSVLFPASYLTWLQFWPQGQMWRAELLMTWECTAFIKVLYFSACSLRHPRMPRENWWYRVFSFPVLILALLQEFPSDVNTQQKQGRTCTFWNLEAQKKPRTLINPKGFANYSMSQQIWPNWWWHQS